MRTRSLALVLALAGSRVYAQPVVHATAVAALEPEQLRTLEATLAGSLGDLPTTVDVSLTRLEVKKIGGDLEVTVELRALVSDETGRIVWSSTAHAAARGSARERVQLHRDAITAAAEALGKRVRSRPPTP